MYGSGFQRVSVRRRWSLPSQGKRAKFLQSTSATPEKPPSTAPRPSINIKSIRQNPQLFAQNSLDRNYKKQAGYPQEIIKLSDRSKALQEEGRGRRERNNVISTHLSKPDQDAQTRSTFLEEARRLKNALQTIEKDEKSLDERTESLAIELPNLTSDETPRGSHAKTRGLVNEDTENKIISLDPSVHDQAALGDKYELIDFINAGVVSGWGWYYLDNEAALLEQALVQYAIHTALKHGFKVSSPPSMVYSHIGALCGFRPRDQSGEQQVYNIQQSKSDIARGTPALSLAGTAEIPFAGRYAKKVLETSDLPVRIVGSSRCYRAEAGARGAQAKGLYRVHEFTKVEMFAWTVPTAEQETFDAMIAVQVEILQRLGLYCRILEMPSMDLGASASRKCDIEAYFPSRKKLGGWGEVTSASMCTDYQTRRLETKMKIPGTTKTTFPSTVSSFSPQI